jgi:agmatine deiminase
MPNTYDTPRAAGFHQPAEWAPHHACWLAWPSHGDLWQENLEDAQTEFLALCRAIVDVDPRSGKPRGEKLEILVPDDEALRIARVRLEGLSARFHRIPFGDIWLRDTAPIFLSSQAGSLATVRFGFNGWGEKYVLPDDDQVSARIAQTVDLRAFSFPWILEGGSVDVDGEGTILTTRQCLLNPNRNPGMSEADVETGLRDAFGVSKVIWLGDGLLNDHTDGHIDTIARFAAPGVVVCMEAKDPAKDPNEAVLRQIAKDLETATDAKGRKLRVVRIPSPGRVVSDSGNVVPASYTNFYIGNTTVVVPTYGTAFDDEAVARIAELFPGRRTIGSSAIAILTGGGAFHCITQQQPAGDLR